MPRRLPTVGGAFDAYFRAAPHDADRAAELRLVRPHDHVEQMLVGHHVLEQLSLLLVGHFVELLVNWHASVDRLVDVDAPQRFPATNWCGSAALRVWAFFCWPTVDHRYAEARSKLVSRGQVMDNRHGQVGRTSAGAGWVSRAERSGGVGVVHLSTPVFQRMRKL